MRIATSLLSAAALVPLVYGQLNTLAKAKGLKYFGSATDNSELSDTTYVDILKNTSNFGQITPGNTQKWMYVEPSEGTFDFTQGDVITSFAEGNGQMLRCHNLVWYNELPSWVTSGTWTNATLISALKTHIQGEVTHYKGQCYCWDVVNEALNDDGTWRSDVFYNTIGTEYVPIAFETAALYDPNVKLYYNDYNIEYSGAKATAAQNIVKSLQARGIKIDGVGLQGHFIVGETPTLSAQTSNLESFTALGVEVAYTEVDIRFTSLPPSTSGYTQQATDYVNTVSACLATTDCVGITLWDFTDKYSWIPSTFSGQGDACLWNADFSTKPAYTSVISLLGGAAATSTGTATSSSASSTSTSTGGTLPKWSQCGGIGWSGSGTCVAGTTCTFQNDWYSQCL
ncbi:carbohydrate-binding module family 1 protein [Oidiodendron maius Zn]|uniref:Beta-xylanase n=1 Tax=Oidiodendron maius (strain Zn) TaxID=913774 RepID=A0A0C3CXD1_OIDMZ|nr:carbohydrate-binding module family 1 protein [Oidiodendron maius Zn]